MPTLSFKSLKTKVGHATLKGAKTGCTVLLFDSRAECAVHTAGGSPGTRETDLLDPSCRLNKINAILLTGGSAFGLAAADGIMRFLAERKIGHAIDDDRIPIVPAAVIYDRRTGKQAAPGPADGYRACKDVRYSEIKEGNVGAGCGATIGKFNPRYKPSPGGVSVLCERFQGITMGVVMVVNSLGNVIDPASGKVIAGATNSKGKKVPFTLAGARFQPGKNTTIGVIVTDAFLNKAEAKRVAITAHDGLAKTIDPSHTLHDGDTIFVVSTGKKKADPAMLGVWAAQLSARAVIRAIEKSG